MPRAPATRMALLATLLCAVSAAACQDNATRTAKSVITLTPELLDFGTRAPGTTTTLALTITNEGTAVLHLSAVEVRADVRQAFAAGDFPREVAPAEKATLSVTYKAGLEAGADSATLLLRSDADNAPAASVPLLGKTAAASCTDQLKNQDESAVDCGGAHCPGCAAGSVCGTASDCAAPLGCAGGVCGACAAASDCRGGQVCTNGECTGCLADKDCAAGSTCVSGACEPCPGATGAIDTRSDPANCGACGHVCPAPANAPVQCRAGQCGRGPCAPGWFDFDPAVDGCETHCVGHECTLPGGGTTHVDSDPIPEGAASFHGFSSGSSVGGEVQTSPGHTHMGTLGESTPPSADGSAILRSAHHRFQGGLNSALH